MFFVYKQSFFQLDLWLFVNPKKSVLQRKHERLLPRLLSHLDMKWMILFFLNFVFESHVGKIKRRFRNNLFFYGYTFFCIPYPYNKSSSYSIPSTSLLKYFKRFTISENDGRSPGIPAQHI